MNLATGLSFGILIDNASDQWTDSYIVNAQKPHSERGNKALGSEQVQPKSDFGNLGNSTSGFSYIFNSGFSD